MKLFIKLAILFIVIGCFTGCSLLPERIIYKDKTTLIVPPNKLLTTEVIPTPPDKETYISLSPLDRERALVIYNIQLLEIVGILNGRIVGMHEWVVKQKKIYEQKKE